MRAKDCCLRSQHHTQQCRTPPCAAGAAGDAHKHMHIVAAAHACACTVRPTPEPRRLRKADALDVVLDGVGGADTHHICHQVAQPGGCQQRKPQLGAKIVVYLLARHQL